VELTDQIEDQFPETYYTSHLQLKRELCGIDDGIAIVSISRPNSLAIADVQVTSGSVDELRVPVDGSSVEFISGKETSSLGLTFDRETTDLARLVHINGLGIESGSAVKLLFSEDLNKVGLINKGLEKGYTVSFEQIGFNPSSYSSTEPIYIEENSAGWFTPLDWNDMVNTPIMLDHDIGNDGTIEYTETLPLPSSDTEQPVIESVTLYPANTTAGSTIDISVSASDNVGVDEVTADGTPLTNSDGLWQGSITAPSTTGDYTLTIRAEDAAENSAETIVDYSVVIPTGGLGTAILPKISSAPAGSTLPLDIKIVSTENFDDVLHVYLTLDGIPPDYQADLGWFDWTETTVQAPAGGEIMLPIAVDIPDGASPGYKSFGVKVESIKWSSDTQDYGAIMVT
jgi:hypothetical protein